MVRPAATGLATAFFRLYLLEALARAPDRPASVLASIAGEGLPFANGAFGRALQSLIEGGHVTAAPGATVTLTPLGAAERIAERQRWAAVLPTLVRLLGTPDARPAPVVSELVAATARPAAVADAYLDRVLVSAVRERIAAFRDRGPSFAIVLAHIEIDAVPEATRRAMVHRAIRATLGGTATLLGVDVSAYRYGDAGIAALAPCGKDVSRGERLAALVRARLDELIRTMTATVRAFGGARWCVRAGAATWNDETGTSTLLLRRAEEALASDTARRAA